MVGRRLLRQTSLIVRPRLHPPLPAHLENVLFLPDSGWEVREHPEGNVTRIHPDSNRTPSAFSSRSSSATDVHLSQGFPKIRSAKGLHLGHSESPVAILSCAFDYWHAPHAASSCTVLSFSSRTCRSKVARPHSCNTSGPGERRWPLHPGHDIPSRIKLRCTVLTEQQCIGNRVERQVSLTCLTTKTPSASWMRTVPQGPLVSS